jgi:hypothetical protein
LLILPLSRAASLGTPIPPEEPLTAAGDRSRQEYPPDTHFLNLGRVLMANHLTPGELADQLRMNQQEVIGRCVQMGVPIFHGRIDRTLFETSLRQLGAARKGNFATGSSH